jgi:acid phosphatase family membrane protein YuiD
VSSYIIAILAAWFFAHLIKYLFICNKNKSLRFSLGVFDSGGMPSAHTALLSSATAVIGLTDGFNSGLFALAAAMLAIVMHDAMRVRRSAGEQGLALSKIIKEQKFNVEIPHIYKGHTPLEVIFGLILGILIGVIVFLATK